MTATISLYLLAIGASLCLTAILGWYILPEMLGRELPGPPRFLYLGLGLMLLALPLIFLTAVLS